MLISDTSQVMTKAVLLSGDWEKPKFRVSRNDGSKHALPCSRRSEPKTKKLHISCRVLESKKKGDITASTSQQLSSQTSLAHPLEFQSGKHKANKLIFASSKRKSSPPHHQTTSLTAFKALKRALTVLWGFLEPITWQKQKLSHAMTILLRCRFSSHVHYLGFDIFETSQIQNGLNNSSGFHTRSSRGWPKIHLGK